MAGGPQLSLHADLCTSLCASHRAATNLHLGIIQRIPQLRQEERHFCWRLGRAYGAANENVG